MSNLKDNLDRASERAGEKLRQTSTRVKEAADATRTAATDAYAVARERASAAYESAKSHASDTGRRARGTIEENPMAALVGGLAVGALVGALLPRSKGEEKILGDLGSRLGDAGRDQLDKLGITADAARDKVSRLIDGAVSAVRDRDS